MGHLLGEEQVGSADDRLLTFLTLRHFFDGVVVAATSPNWERTADPAGGWRGARGVGRGDACGVPRPRSPSSLPSDVPLPCLLRVVVPPPFEGGRVAGLRFGLREEGDDSSVPRHPSGGLQGDLLQMYLLRMGLVSPGRDTHDRGHQCPGGENDVPIRSLHSMPVITAGDT